MPLLAAMLCACGLALLKIRSSNLIALSFFRVFTPLVIRNSTVRLICLTRKSQLTQASKPMQWFVTQLLRMGLRTPRTESSLALLRLPLHRHRKRTKRCVVSLLEEFGVLRIF